MDIPVASCTQGMHAFERTVDASTVPLIRFPYQPAIFVPGRGALLKACAIVRMRPFSSPEFGKIEIVNSVHTHFTMSQKMGTLSTPSIFEH